MRRKLTLAVLFLIMTLLLCTGCQAREKKRYQASYLTLFDTVTTILGYEEDQDIFSAEAARIHDQMEAYDHLYDIYHEYPDLVNLCTVNRHPGETFTVDQRIIDLLKLAREADEFSGHRTNAMFGAVLRIWHEVREEGIEDPESARLPELSELEAAAGHTGFEYLEMDEAARTVRLTDPEASLDVGALAKGYAVQKVCETLPEGYLLSVGGNVVATGPKPDGSAWLAEGQTPEGKLVSGVCEAGELYIPLGDLVDLEQEKKRLAKEEKNLEGEIARSEGKLNNPGFTGKAPAALVEAERAKLEKNRQMLETLKKRIAELG